MEKREREETEDEVKQAVRDRSYRILFAIVGISTIMRNGNPWQDVDYKSERIRFILLKKKKNQSATVLKTDVKDNGGNRKTSEKKPVAEIQMEYADSPN